MAYKLCPFYSISVISGRWDADNERLCAMGPSYWSERFPPLAGFGSETAEQNRTEQNFIHVDKHVRSLTGDIRYI